MEGNVQGKLMEDKSCFSLDSSQCLGQVCEDGKGHSTGERRVSLYKERGQTVPPVCVISSLPSAQNNPYVTEAYFGVGCSDPLHCQPYFG